MRDENMSYTVKSSERLRKSGSEAETKALLYLMNFRPDSDDIYYFVVDFFNDLTGMDNMASRLWDVQSKGAHHVSPKAIGKELVTLFKNYMSPLTFEAYILFIGSVTGSLRKDSSLTTFGIVNVKDAAIEQIKLGLHEEGSAKEYIDSTDLTDENINGFLRKVFFVIDDGKKPSEYVKAIIRQHPNIIPEEKILNAIFNEIRDKQASKKNISSVEGIVIETTDEALNYCRHLTNNEIRLMTLQRIIKSWMRSRNTLEFLRQWENDMNEGFDDRACEELIHQGHTTSLTITPSLWIRKTHAVGIQVKQGKGGGVSAYPEIAAGFQLWIDPKVRLAIVRKHM